MAVRILIDGAGRTGEATPEDLPGLYRPPRLPWLRVNMVSTVDGAANGESGTSGSINNEADGAVFHALRAACDAVIVGAGTARAEEYGEADVPVVLVSRRGLVPPTLRAAAPGKVLLATCAGSPGLDEARALLGADSVIVAGADDVDLMAVKQELVSRGLTHLLGEGGPSLLRALLASGAADELDLTWVPQVIGGDHPRILAGDAVAVDLDLALLLEHEGTLLGRWLVRTARDPRGATPSGTTA